MDLLVRLYEIKDDRTFLTAQAEQGILLRKPIGTEKNALIQWVRENFQEAWASETDTALSLSPIRCFVAVRQRKFIGFGCYDAAALGFFGPLGVLPPYRGKGTGKALLLSCLLDMKLLGYGYGVIGMARPESFYKHCVGATRITRSSASIWKSWVRHPGN